MKILLSTGVISNLINIHLQTFKSSKKTNNLKNFVQLENKFRKILVKI